MAQLCNVIPPPEEETYGQLTQESGTTAYEICPEVTFMKSRWVRRGKAIQISCYYKCNTASNSWTVLSRGIPLATADLDHNVHPIVYDFSTGKVVTDASALIQTGIFYVQGGVAGKTYFIEYVFLTD